MTYSSGGLIQAVDYNGFANDTGGANVNAVWGAGSGDRGWGQSSTLSTVSAAGTVTATQWADLVNRITSLGNQTSTSLTARSAPTAGATINILSNLNTDLTNCTTNRGNAAAVGTTYATFGGTTSKTGATANNQSGWTITFTHTVTFPSANQARYFWNAGGRVLLDFSKTSTGTDTDPDWNSFAATIGTISFVGRVNGANQTLAGTSYTGTTKTGGSGTPNTLTTGVGWYNLSAGAAATTIFKQFDNVYQYTSNFIQVTAARSADSTVLTLVTSWFDSGYPAVWGRNNSISGGTATASPFTAFGTAPTTLCRYVPPSTTYLTNTWGTPTISASVS
jgi:hypothetical protein